MVGHTGNMDATIIGVEAVDLALARLIPVVEKENAILVVTADHGNADEMLEKNKKGVVSVRTAHSLNPVPFIISTPTSKSQTANSDCPTLRQPLRNLWDSLPIRIGTHLLSNNVIY